MLSNGPFRDNDIDRHKSLLKSRGKPTINTRSTLTVAKRRFQRIEREVQTVDRKFKGFRIEMDTLSEKGLLSPPLTVFHNRLLLEDVMMAIEIDQELVLGGREGLRLSAIVMLQNV